MDHRDPRESWSDRDQISDPETLEEARKLIKQELINLKHLKEDLSEKERFKHMDMGEYYHWSRADSAVRRSDTRILKWTNMKWAFLREAEERAAEAGKVKR